MRLIQGHQETASQCRSSFSPAEWTSLGDSASGPKEREMSEKDRGTGSKRRRRKKKKTKTETRRQEQQGEQIDTVHLSQIYQVGRAQHLCSAPLSQCQLCCLRLTERTPGYSQPARARCPKNKAMGAFQKH